MTFYVENETKAVFDFDIEAVAGQVFDAACAHEACPYEAEVCLTITDEAGIRELNLRHRGIDKATDVLSFPAVDYEMPADFSLVKENEAAYLNPETDALMLGDIVVCEQRIREQAEQYGHSEKREFAFLLAHSMLHLFGYDHMTEQEETVMFRRQEEILQKIGVGRQIAKDK